MKLPSLLEGSYIIIVIKYYVLTQYSQIITNAKLMISKHNSRGKHCIFVK